VGVAKTKEVLKAKISGVGRTYCLQVWKEALNQTGVEASSTLRRAKNVYYPLVIRAYGPSSFSGPQVAIVSNKENEDKGSPAKIPPSPTSPPKEAEQVKATEKEKEKGPSKGVVPDTTKPLVAPKDPSKGRETSQHLEIVLATLPVPAKDDPKGKCLASTTAETANPPKATGKENPPLKIK